MAEVRDSQFSLDIRKWTEKAKGNADKVVRAVSMECLSRIVMRTPVGNPDLWQSKPPKGYVGGRLRGSWVVSLGEPSGAQPGRIDPSGAATIAAGNAVISGARAGSSVYLMSNLPYAVPIEYGHSQQSPAGMVRITVADFRGMVTATTRALS